MRLSRRGLFKLGAGVAAAVVVGLPSLQTEPDITDVSWEEPVDPRLVSALPTIIAQFRLLSEYQGTFARATTGVARETLYGVEVHRS